MHLVADKSGISVEAIEKSGERVSSEFLLNLYAYHQV